MTGYFFDQFGDLTFFDLPGLGISMIFSALLVFLLGFSMPADKRKGIVPYAATLAALVALLVSLGRTSMPAAVLIAGLMIMAFPLLRTGDRNEGLFTFGAMVLGLGCGLKAVVIVALVLPILFLLNRLVK